MSKFFWRRMFPSMLLVAAFVLLYEATVSDSRYAARQAELLRGTLKPIPGTRFQFKATAYCKGYTTASGVAVRSGVAAADPDILPVGSVIQADFESHKYDGIYTIMDTGPEVQGNEIDVYMWSCFDALRFGRQDVHIVVLRLGWNPKNTTPVIETLFHRRIPDGPPEPEPEDPPREPRPPRIPPSAVTPIPNPTFETPASASGDDGNVLRRGKPASASGDDGNVLRRGKPASAPGDGGNVLRRGKPASAPPDEGEALRRGRP